MNRFGLVISFALLGALAALSSCNIVTPIAYLAKGPAKVPAECQLPDRPTVVFVDDRRNVLNDRSVRAYMGDKIGQFLLRQKVLSAEKEHAIRTGSALTAARDDELGNLRSLEEIGAAVDAAQVIYVDLHTFQIESPDGRFQTQAQFGVKVIDVENRTRLFPDPESDSEMRQMVVTLPPERTFQPLFGREARREAELALADLIADRVAKLFYKHEPRTPLGHRAAPQTNPKFR